MIINKHDLDGSTATGNGHHGNCKHCGLALVTDLGYCSWNNTKCIDREIEINNLPEKVQDYINFCGLRWNGKEKKYIKPFSETEYTINELIKHVNNIKN